MADPFGDEYAELLHTQTEAAADVAQQAAEKGRPRQMYYRRGWRHGALFGLAIGYLIAMLIDTAEKVWGGG